MNVGLTAEVEWRFYRHVDKKGPLPRHRPELGRCWSYTGGTDRSGYGKFFLDGRYVMAHRVGWMLEAGCTWPRGLVADHLCRNPNCVRGTHIEPVTQRENILRGDLMLTGPAGRTRCPAGHLYAGANLYVDPKGHRHCRACRSLRRRGKPRSHRTRPRSFRVEPRRGRQVTFPVVDGMKRCTHCREVKPVADFPVERRRRTGVSAWCKTCQAARQVAWRAGRAVA